MTITKTLVTKRKTKRIILRSSIILLIHDDNSPFEMRCPLHCSTTDAPDRDSSKSRELHICNLVIDHLCQVVLRETQLFLEEQRS